MRPPVAVCALIAAIALALLQRASRFWDGGRRALPFKMPRESCAIVKICIALRDTDKWISVVDDVVRKCAGQPRVCVALACSRTEVPALPPYLRGIVEVHARVGAYKKSELFSKLVRRFVAGDETVVAFCDPTVRLFQNWDMETVQALKRSDGAVVTSPIANKPGCFFPTLTPRGRRGASKPFHTSYAGHSVPSVCLCEEFFAGSPKTLLQLREEGVVWTASDLNVPVRCATFQILEPSDKKNMLRIEAAAARTVWPRSTTRSLATCGLTSSANVHEANAKFGGVQKAKLAAQLSIQNQNDRGTDDE